MLLSAVPLPGVSVGAALQQLMRCAASEASESPGTRLRGGFAWLGAQRSHGAVIRPHCWNFRDQCTRSKQLLWVPSCEAEIWPRPKSTPAAMNGRVGLIQHTWHRSAELCWRKGAPLLQSRGRQVGSGRRTGRPDQGWYQRWWKQWKRGSISMGQVRTLQYSPLTL